MSTAKTKQKKKQKTQHERRTPLMDLFPEIEPYSTGFLDVDETHRLYWEQSGNPDGEPIILLHGGPGAGASPVHRRFFDPDHYRIIIFDQRGAGRSHPLGCIEDNSLTHLIDDMEKLRQRLMVDRWHVFGGSWGSTLALAYAKSHPQRCLSLILRGIFLLEQREVDWFLYGMRNVFPEAWEQFTQILSDDEKNDVLRAYYKKLTGTNEKEQLEAAISWTLYESACASLMPNFEIIVTEEQKQHALALARLEAHYFLHEVISPEKSLLHNIEALRAIPAVIVQGRYDIICPIRTAHKLHQLWPEADYIVVSDGGHSAMDPAIRSRLIETTENMKTVGR